MLEHYIIQALRSFWRFRFTAGVNLLGLVLAVVCFIATYLYIDSLVRGDSQFPKAARTYMITQEIRKNGAKLIPAFPSAGPPTAKYLRADFPGLETVARAYRLGRQSAATSDRKAEVSTAAIDPEFLEIFDFQFKAGEPTGALAAVHSALITERTAQRLFGTAQAVGQRILLQNRDEVTVTGVIADVTQPSHMAAGDGSLLTFDVLVPMQLLREIVAKAGISGPVGPDDPDWSVSYFLTYVLFPADESFTPQEFIEQLPAFAERRANNTPASPFQSIFGAVPVSRVVLALDDALYGGNAVSITTMIFVLDALLLAIACINYANLAVAIATTRAKELGVRKVLGATRLHLMRQCLIEAGLLGFTAVALVVVLTVLVIEPVNRNLGTNFTFASLLRPQLWLLVVGLIAAISCMGGAYPAIALASVRPVDALRVGSVQAGPSFVPTILVGVQFAAASFLLVVALLMAHQNALLLERGLQGGRDPVVVIQNNLNDVGVSLDTLREELLRSPNIKAVASVVQSPWADGGTHVRLTRSSAAAAAGEETLLNAIGYGFFDVIDVKLLAGRLLDRQHRDDFAPLTEVQPNQPQPVVIDRALAAALGWRDPNEAIDQITYFKLGPYQVPAHIVGVVENGYPRLVGPNTASNIYGVSTSLSGVPLIRISREHIAETVKYIDSTWDRLAPKVQIQREFMDALFNSAYRNYSRIHSTLNGLSVFAFLIAVMGLCGLAIHVTTRRQREIGIRKTLGASVRGVVTMLLFDFAKPVLVANLIAWPFAWFVGHQYLDKFTLRSEITLWPFVLSLIITVGVAWASVAFQAMRAATVKPARVLYAQ